MTGRIRRAAAMLAALAAGDPDTAALRTSFPAWRFLRYGPWHISGWRTWPAGQLGDQGDANVTVAVTGTFAQVSALIAASETVPPPSVEVLAAIAGEDPGGLAGPAVVRTRAHAGPLTPALLAELIPAGRR